MKQRLAPYTEKKQLKDWANYLISKGLAPPLTRLAPRHRDAMICWFCANAPNFPEGLPAELPLPEISKEHTPAELAEKTQWAHKTNSDFRSTMRPIPLLGSFT
jgi:hypothetical protein